MHRVLKIFLYSTAAVALLVVMLGVFFFRSLYQRNQAQDLEQQVQLSNHAFLQIHGASTPGPDSGYSWTVSYRSESGWEKAGDWWDGSQDSRDANLIACPLGKVVVIAKTDGSRVFVLTEAGTWKTLWSGRESFILV